MNKNIANTNRSSRAYSNTVLTAIAVLLAVLVVDSNSGLVGPISTASAQHAERQRSVGGFVDPAVQRITIIAELNELNGRLKRIERTMAKGLNVRLLNAPVEREK